MFSPAGESAVRKAVAKHTADFAAARENGFAVSEAKAAATVEKVQAEVAAQGFPEVHDTAVRETIWNAVEDAAGVRFV